MQIGEKMLEKMFKFIDISQNKILHKGGGSFVLEMCNQRSSTFNF